MKVEVIPNESQIKIMPVKFECDKSLGDDIPKPLPSSSFFMYVCGRPASGKSTLASNLLCSKEFYRKRFDNIYLVIPPNSLASLPKRHMYHKHIETNPDFHYSDLNSETLNEILQRLKKSRSEGETSLLVIDDMLHALKRTDVLFLMAEIAANRRHLKTSVMVLSQVWNSLPLIVRKQITHTFVWRCSKKEFNSLYEEQFDQITRDEAEAICAKAWDDAHAFLFIDCINNKYYDSEFAELKLIA